MTKKSPTFEELFQELESTIEKLEAGNLTLDEALTLYERGMELARQCGEQLDRAELRIKELTPREDIVADAAAEYETDSPEEEPF